MFHHLGDKTKSHSLASIRFPVKGLTDCSKGRTNGVCCIKARRINLARRDVVNCLAVLAGAMTYYGYVAALLDVDVHKITFLLPFGFIFLFFATSCGLGT
jgi:hypothetical protein